MTATRLPFTRADILPTAGLFLMGILFSFGLVGGIMFLFHGLWILWPVILFLLIFQLIFEGGVRLIWWTLRRSWRALRGLPPPPQAIPPRPPEPWLKSHAILLGIAVGGTYLVVGSWLNGTLSGSGGLL